MSNKQRVTMSRDYVQCSSKLKHEKSVFSEEVIK